MQADVLIIGAGLAGLSLADKLQRDGQDFLLLEARDRFGGRILSEPFGDSAFDLGPAWFWPGQPRMASLVKRFNLAVFEQFASGDIVSEDHRGNVRRGKGFASMQGSYRLAGGLGKLTAALAAALPKERIHLNTKLNSLTQHGTGVEAVLETGHSTFQTRANKIVLAVPPRVVAKTVRFVPNLPQDAMKALAAIPTWMAGQAKVVAIYDRPYWREAGLSGDAMSQFGPMAEIHDASPHEGGPFALFGFVGVPADVRAEHKDQLVQLAKEQLNRVFGGVLPEPQRVIFQDWAAEPFTATQKDVSAGGGHPAYGYPIALQNMWNGSLFLGSTEVAAQFGGYLEGALEAAENSFSLLENEAPVQHLY